MATKAKNTEAAQIAPDALESAALPTHEGEMIIPAADYEKLMSSSALDPENVPALVEEIRKLRARVLCLCDFGAPNDVVEVDAELAKARTDVLDTDPAAVAYALSQAV